MDINAQKCPSSGSDPDTSTSAATTGMVKSLESMKIVPRKAEHYQSFHTTVIFLDFD